MDNELFELCKEVYEVTGWDDDGLGKQMWVHDGLGDVEFVDSIGEDEGFWDFPLYTSDYLLEKLPRYIGEYHPFCLKEIDGHSEGSWCALYSDDIHDGILLRVSQFADTPLKALLKLTIALHDAGELK